MEILSIGEKIRNRRKELNMTLKELAGDRVTAGQLSFVELGKSNPSSELLQYIAERLGVTVDYLLESQESQARKVCEYNINLARAYIYDNKDKEAEPLMVKGAEIAERFNLGDLMGQIELNRGKIACKGHEYQKATEYYLRANRLFLENGGYIGATDTYIMLGEVSCKSGFHGLAVSYFKQAESLSKEKGLFEEQIEAKINFSICMCCINMGQTDRVDKYLPMVEQYLNTISCKKEYGHKMVTMSAAYSKVGEYDKSLHYAGKALDIFREIEDEEYLSRVQMQIGIIYSQKNEFVKSDYYLEHCERLKENLDDGERVHVLLKLAYNSISENNFKRAVEYVERSFKLAVEHMNVEHQIECYSCLYKIYVIENNYCECENVLKSKLNLIESMDKPDKLAECYMDMGEFYNLTGDKDKAVEYMGKGLKILKDLKRT